MLISDYFNESSIHIDGEFRDLGYATHHGIKILTFCDNLYYLHIALKNPNISAIIINKNLICQLTKTTKGICISPNPRKDFFTIYIDMYHKGLFSTPIIKDHGKNITIAQSAQVSPECYIGNNTVISENVVINKNVFIQDNCFIDAGVVLGNEGILYSTDDKGNNSFIRHAGIVSIGNNVTILSNATIVKSVFPNMPTIIDDYSIIGIATTIGHEAHIGKNCQILGNCVVAKNAEINDRTLIGSSSVIRENVKIGKHVSVKAGSIVINNIKDGKSVSGNFAMDHNKSLKNYIKNQRV